MFDTKCLDLAEEFLLDHPQLETHDEHTARAAQLAQAIQDAIENWLEEHPAEIDPDARRH